jgi:hypothetical protein
MAAAERAQSGVRRAWRHGPRFVTEVEARCRTSSERLFEMQISSTEAVAFDCRSTKSSDGDDHRLNRDVFAEYVATHRL